MNNIEYWDKLKGVPDEVKKPITGGRLKGMTDIKPIWRYQVMTETFGPVGIGWYFEITRQWTEQGTDNQLLVFTNVDLYVKHGQEWSKPIPGTGGSMIVTKEAKGHYNSDEGYKMALTDALSVAMKHLGVAADVYFGNKNESKYEEVKKAETKSPPDRPEPTDKQFKGIVEKFKEGEIDLERINKHFSLSDFQRDELNKLIG